MMAIDTAARRRNVSGVPFLPLGLGVTPNATKNEAWRRRIAWNYAVNDIEEVDGPITATLTLIPRVTAELTLSAVATGTVTTVPVVTGTLTKDTE